MACAKTAVARVIQASPNTHKKAYTLRTQVEHHGLRRGLWWSSSNWPLEIRSPPLPIPCHIVINVQTLMRHTFIRQVTVCATLVFSICSGTIFPFVRTSNLCLQNRLVWWKVCNPNELIAKKRRIVEKSTPNQTNQPSTLKGKKRDALPNLSPFLEVVSNERHFPGGVGM